jgi:hypothetical protein
MSTSPKSIDALATLRTLSREEIERRLAEIEAERRALQTIRRSIVARDRSSRRHPKVADHE